MKYFIVLLLLVSCDFYSTEKSITINGLSRGFLIVSSKSDYRVIDSISTRSYELNVNKGETYFFTFYRNFYGEISRFPTGGVLFSDKDYITLSPHAGLLTMNCNKLNLNHYNPKDVQIKDFIEYINTLEDPWILEESDVLLYLEDKLPLGYISKKKIFNIDDLNFLYNMEAENPLSNNWYPSVQSFYDINSKEKKHVEIYDNGEFCYFSSR